MTKEIETLIKLAGLKNQSSDALKTTLVEEKTNDQNNNQNNNESWSNTQESNTKVEWYDKATKELVHRIKSGEFEMEVVNDLAREYASMHGGSHEAFQFAVDALSRRAWQMGLSNANDSSQPRYQLQVQHQHNKKTEISEYRMDHTQNPRRATSERCLNLYQQSQQDTAHGRVALSQLRDEMKKHGFDNLDLFLKTCKRVVKQDPSLKNDLTPKKAQEALMFWRKNKIFDLMNFVEGYGFANVQDLLDHIKRIKTVGLNENHSDAEIAAMSRQERIKNASYALADVWSDDRFHGTWNQAVSAVAKKYKISPNELLDEYETVTFPLKGKKRDPDANTINKVIKKWNEYKEKYFNDQNTWRWEELNKIAQDHGYWNLTDFLRRIAKLSNKKIVGINENLGKTLKSTTDDTNDAKTKNSNEHRKVLEGPFAMKTGQVVYYDPKEGKYWDPKTNMHISNEEMHKMYEMMQSKTNTTHVAELRDVLKSLEMEHGQNNNAYGSHKFSSNVKDFYAHVREFPYTLTGDNSAHLYHDVVVYIQHPHGHTEVKSGPADAIHKWMPEHEVLKHAQDFATYELSLDPPYPMNESSVVELPVKIKPA